MLEEKFKTFIEILPGKTFKTEETKFPDSTEIVFLKIKENLSKDDLYPKWFNFSIDFIVINFPLENSIKKFVSCELDSGEIKIYSQEDFERNYSWCNPREWEGALLLFKSLESTLPLFRQIMV